MPPSRPSEPTPSAGLRNDPLDTVSSRRRQSSFRDQTFRDQRASHIQNEFQASPSTRYANPMRPFPSLLRQPLTNVLESSMTPTDKWVSVHFILTHFRFMVDSTRTIARGEAMLQELLLANHPYPILLDLSTSYPQSTSMTCMLVLRATSL